jgi:hypothetical protein
MNKISQKLAESVVWYDLAICCRTFIVERKIVTIFQGKLQKSINLILIASLSLLGGGLLLNASPSYGSDIDRARSAAHNGNKNLAGADLTDANYNGKTKFPEGFDPNKARMVKHD